MDLPSRPSVGAGPLCELKGALLLPGAEEQQGGTPRRSLSWAKAKGYPWTCLHVHAFLLPQAFFVLSVLLGCWDSCYGADDCARPRSVFNWLFVALGPVLPLAVLGVRLVFLPFRKSEAVMTVIVWTFMATVRLVIYAFWMGPSNWFSDHIFLMACILGMLQTEIAYAHEFVQKSCTAAVPPLLAAYFLIWRISAEAYVTSSSYHSRIQSCLALLLGVPLFSGIAMLWVHFVRLPMEPEAPSDSEAGVGASGPRHIEDTVTTGNSLETAPAGGGSPFAEDLPPIRAHSFNNKNCAARRREGAAADQGGEGFAEDLPPIRAQTFNSKNCAARRREGAAADQGGEGRPRAASEYAGGAPQSELPQRSASAYVGRTGEFVVHKTPSFGESDQAQAAPPLPPPASAPPHGTLESPQGALLESWPAASAFAGTLPSPPHADAQPGAVTEEVLVPPSGAGAFGDGTPSSAGGANPFADAAESPRDPLAPAAAAAAEAGSAEGPAPAPEPRSCSSGEELPTGAAPAPAPTGPGRLRAEGQERSPGTAAAPEWRDRREQPKRQSACCAFVPGFRRQPNASETGEEDDHSQRRSGIKDF